MPQHWCGDPSPKGSPRSVGEATKNYAREVSFPGAISYYFLIKILILIRKASPDGAACFVIYKERNHKTSLI